MSEQDRHGERELASFIRAGAERRPEQAYGDYFKGQRASCLEGTIRRCPGGDGCQKRLSLAAIIVHLNDDHRWSREQIAQWLEAVNGKPSNGVSRPAD
jgi:hypothetical protein